MVPIARAYLTAQGAWRQFTSALLFIVDVFLVKSLNLMGLLLDIFWKSGCSSLRLRTIRNSNTTGHLGKCGDFRLWDKLN
jgi:hypothetical protein